MGGSFLATAAAMAAFIPPHRHAEPLTIGLLVLAYAITSRVEFEVGTGLVVPTQLILVPMLFLAPTGAVPLLVALGLLLGRLPDVLGGRMPFDRTLLLFVNSWHAVGPALVLGLTEGGRPSWGHWPYYVAALAAQFGFDIASSGTRERLSLGLSFRPLLTFMRWAFLVDTTLAPVALAVVVSQHRVGYLVLIMMPLVGLLAVFARERQGRIDQELEVSHAYQRAALLLGKIVESSDTYTGLHSRQVVSLAVDVAKLLGLGARERRMTELAALLHDVGKIRVPLEIIGKRGPLSEDERSMVRLHTIEGEQILAQVGGLLAEVGRIVRSSHERYDGLGYPDGLAGESIPLLARIVSPCDALSAMVTDRPYRRALSLDGAVSELRSNSGGQFDPVVVEALESVIREDRQVTSLLEVNASSSTSRVPSRLP